MPSYPLPALHNKELTYSIYSVNIEICKCVFVRETVVTHIEPVYQPEQS